MAGNRQNVNYSVLITHHGETAPNNTVTAFLPERISLRLSSDWEPVFSQMLDSALGSGAAIGRAAGIIPFDKFLTGQVWRSSDPIDFQLDLEFDAEATVQGDVTDPVRRLIGWASPKRRSGGSFLIDPPGPTIIDQTNRMSLRIGRMLLFDNIIFPSVDVTWYTAPHSSGQFIAADVSLSCRTFFTPDRQDIDEFFGRGLSGDNSSVFNPATTTEGLAGLYNSAVGAGRGAIERVTRVFAPNNATAAIPPGER